MSDYDIGKAFEKIENELIDSMMRNFSRHRAEETKEGYNWAQWQAEQLKALEEYRKTNAKKFGKQFKSINSKVEEMIHTARADGNAEQELKILEAIKNGFTPNMPTGASTGEFFKVNDRKLNALVKSTTDDLKRAETAVLRMSNDKYRKAIFNAQVYANTGAGTYEKAVDMACKDMLNAGLNCVEYKNGARHTLSDYADMAIKTANKRAYLRGEGEERAKYGLFLVVVNSRQGGCPDCAKYIGKVFIDDVYSNGKKSDGDYPLLSTAIAEGLFHPRCKDSTSTHYPELDDLSGPLSDDELAELDRQRGLEVQQQQAEKQAERFDRRAKYSLDEDNKRIAQTRADEWHDRADMLEEKVKNTDDISPESVAKSAESGINCIVTNEMYTFSDGYGKSSSPVKSIIYKTPDGTRFVFPEKYNASHQQMTPEKAISLWNQIPQEVRNQAQKTIEFVDYYNPADSYWRKHYKNFTHSYATGGDKITFWRYNYQHDDDYVIRTYCHEAGHFIDKNLSSSVNARFSDENVWTKAMKDDKIISGKKSCTAYGQNAHTEDFAESLAEYIKDKIAFSSAFPNRATLLDKILKKVI